MFKSAYLCTFALFFAACGNLLLADDTPKENSQPRRPRGNVQQRGPRDISATFKRLDANKNGTLEGQEIPAQLRRRVKQIDTNKDGKLSLEEVQKSRGGRRPGTGSDRRKGEVITGAAKASVSPIRSKLATGRPTLHCRTQVENAKSRFPTFKERNPSY
jgi:hypothetical protein